METWPSAFAFFLVAFGAGFTFSAALYFSTFFVSTRWTEFWSGSAPKD